MLLRANIGFGIIKVTSNSIFFTNWDDAYIHEEYGGNVLRDTSGKLRLILEAKGTAVHTALVDMLQPVSMISKHFALILQNTMQGFFIILLSNGI